MIMQMTMMHGHGKHLSKAKLFDRSNSRYVGRCVVSEIQDIETRRTMLIARSANSPDVEGGCRLYDARLVWMNEDVVSVQLRTQGSVGCDCKIIAKIFSY
jgi:hypothetical protein